MTSIESFIASVKNIDRKRKHRITGSLGVYHAYKYIRKNKWMNIGRPLTEHEFYTIIRTVDNIIAEELSNGNDVKLPERMGRIELRKSERGIRMTDGKLKVNLPVDWDRTLKLWYEDKEAFKNKILVRSEDREVFKFYYNKSEANYNNKSFYQFKVNRDIKQKLKNNIKNGIIDAFKI